MPARLATVSLVGALSVFALTGCGSGFVDGTAEDTLEETIEQGADGQVDADISGTGEAEVPAPWPSKVPLLSGKLISSATLGTISSLQYELPDRASADAYLSALEAAGFDQIEASTGDGGGLWTYGDGEYRVDYSIADAGTGDGTVIAGISVQQELQ